MAKEIMYEHHHGKGWMVFILGLLVIANTYWQIVGWDYFIGIILLLAGLIKIAMHKCC